MKNILGLDKDGIQKKTQTDFTEKGLSLEILAEKELEKEQSDEIESFGKALRESGLAWSSAIALFASVVFMMIIGWIIDVLMGTKPIGIVVGIVFGATIGFYQFFRITSQIFK